MRYFVYFSALRSYILALKPSYHGDDDMPEIPENLTVDRERGVPKYPFAICSPYLDGLPGTAVLACVAYKPHADLFALAPAMAKALQDVLPVLEKIEDTELVGDEGCLWPVESVRDLIARIDGAS